MRKLFHINSINFYKKITQIFNHNGNTADCARHMDLTSITGVYHEMGVPTVILLNFVSKNLTKLCPKIEMDKISGEIRKQRNSNRIPYRAQLKT